MKRRAISIFLLTLAFLGINPLSANAAETTTVQLDLSENTLQFGGFPGVRDEEEILNGIYLDEITDDACMTVSDKEDALESIRALVDRSIDTQAETIDLSEYGLSEDAAVEIISDVLNANPSYFFVEGASAVMTEAGTVDSIELAYAETADEMRVEYDDAIYSILAQVDPDWNDEETIIFLHDYLVTHCQYDYERYYANTFGINACTAYGAIVLHRAVCSGYASAFTELGNRSGIKTSYVSGQAMNHAWNIVELNGDHFYVDCTWDDPGGFYGGEEVHCDAGCSHYNLLLSQDGMISTGHHTPNDWAAPYSGKKDKQINGLYNNKKYDEAEWRDISYRPFVCIDDGVLINNYVDRSFERDDVSDCIEYKAGILKYDCNFGSMEQILDMQTNPSSTLVRIGDSFFICIGDSIYLLNIISGEKKVVYKLPENESESGTVYIAGIEADGNRIKYHAESALSDRKVTLYGVVDVSAYTTSISLDKCVVTFEGLNGSDTIRVITNSDTPVKLESSDTNVATITQGGQITPVGYGSTIIKASVGNTKAFCRVNVDTTWQKEYDYTGVYKFPGNTSSDQYRYIRDVASGFSISGYNGTEDRVIIPTSATISGYTYPLASINLSGNDKISEIIVDGSVKLNKLNLSNCNKLRSVSLNKVETSNMTDISRMFMKCSSLETLDLSTFDLSEVSKASSFLYGCDSLSELDTPTNVRIDIELPGEFEDHDGNVYTMLPKGLSESIHLTRSISVASISIGDDKRTSIQFLDLILGTEKKLTARVSPDNARDKRVKWESTAPSIASVSDDGTVKPLKRSSDYFEIKASSVANPKVSTYVLARVLSVIQGVEFLSKETEIGIGQSKQLQYKTIPEGAEIESENWVSSNTEVATVDNKGNVKGISKGSATITIMVNNMYLCSDSITVNVVDKTIPLESFELETDLLELNIGDEKTLSVKKTPEDATDRLTYSSSNEAIAKVDENGMVKAIGEGQTDIAVIGAGMEKVCHVIVYMRLTGIFPDIQRQTICVDDSLTITATLAPSDIKTTVSCNADDQGRLINFTPSPDGMSASINAISTGRVRITFTATDTTREPAITKTATAIITILDKGSFETDNGFFVSGLKPEYRYASSPVCPDILVYYDGVRLLERREYTVSYSNNKRPGTGYLTITGKGNYSGRSKQIAFNIIRAETGDTSIKKALVTNVEKSYPFTGEPVAVPGLKVDLNGTELKEGEDYIISYRNHIDTGTASIVIEGIGNYKDAITRKFKITPADITTARIEDISTFYKPGGAKPIPVIMYGEYMLKYGVDYKVSWAKNTAAGNGTMTVSGKGNFTGRTTAAFSIRKSDLADTTIAVTDAKYKKNAKGSSYMGKFKVYDTDGKCLKAGRDYILAYENVTKNSTIDKDTGKDEVNEGDVIRVTAYPGSGDNYTGTVSAEYKVTGSVKPISKAPLIKIPAQQYTGAEIKPQISFTGLEENKDYEVLWYCNNVQKGTAKALVRGMGDYSGCRLVSFKIVARKLTN